jgi:hypothetical protein
MDWQVRSLVPGTLEHTPADGRSWEGFAAGLVDDPTLRADLTRRCGVREGVFWECTPTARSHRQAPFRFVTVDSPAVAALQPDPSPFRSYLTRARGPVVSFDNLGRDAVLVAPVGSVPAGCAHLASWCRTAPQDEQHALWQAVGRGVLAWWDQTPDPLWVSTSGLGVPWLHVRLDRRPKYITHPPYRVAPRDAPRG